MAKSFKILRDKMSEQARKTAHDKAEVMLAEMALQELRQAKNFSQEKLAEVLHAKQASISRLERRTDMYISTLRGYIEAMGGQLEIVAKFPEGNIKISQFKDI